MTEYIERKAAVKAIENDVQELVCYTKQDAIESVASVPAVDVALMLYGKWVDREGPDEDGNISEWCSNCGHSDTHSLTVKVPFCWFCGAKMEGGTP